ncbi:MAG: sporulation integral membrane protein YtvI [Lachnospiraceae bacterium]|nr:sporulation integral membrane protein YtvI [Lachnospiraceae bacterium]
MGKSVFLQDKYVKLYKVIGVTAGVYLAFRYALPLFAPFVAAYLLAGAVRPVVLFLKRRLHIPMSVGGGLVLFLLVAVLGTGLIFLGKLLVEQIVRFIENYGGYRDAAMGAAERFCSRVDGWFSLKAGTAGEMMHTGLARVEKAMDDDILPKLSKQSVAAMGSFAYGVAGVIITFVAAVLLLGEKEKYAKGYRRSPFYAEAKQVLGRLSEAGVAYLKTQGILMLLVGLVCTVGFLFVKREYALLLGIGVAVFDAFPVLGSGLILVPWAVVCLLQGNYGSMVILIVMYLLCIVVREGLEPKLLGNRIGIPPLYTLMAVYVGVELFGFWGVILGPFGLVIIRAVLDTEKEEHGFRVR